MLAVDPPRSRAWKVSKPNGCGVRAHPGSPVTPSIERPKTEFYHSPSLLRGIQKIGPLLSAYKIRHDQLVLLRKDIPKEGRPFTRLDILCKRNGRVLEIMRWLLDLYRVSAPPDTDGYRARLVSYKRHALTNAQARGREWGRRYPTCEKVSSVGSFRRPEALALQGAPREVRLILCWRRYSDIDLKNAFPRIAHHLAIDLGLELPTLALYVSSDENREGLLKRLMAHHQLNNRSAAKNLPLVLFHGGQYETWLKEWGPPIMTKLGDMCVFADELRLLAKTMFERKRPGIEADCIAERQQLVLVKRRRDGDDADSLSEAERSMLAYIMQSYEDRILRVIAESFEADGWTIGSLQFDGLFVDKVLAPAGITLDQSRINAEVAVRTKTLFKVGLAEKEMTEEAAEAVYADWDTTWAEPLGEALAPV